MWPAPSRSGKRRGAGSGRNGHAARRTVLDGVHQARVNVEVRVDFDGGDLEAQRLEQHARAAGDDALADAGDDTAGDEDVLDHLWACRCDAAAPADWVRCLPPRRGGCWMPVSDGPRGPRGRLGSWTVWAALTEASRTRSGVCPVCPATEAGGAVAKGSRPGVRWR